MTLGPQFDRYATGGDDIPAATFKQDWHGDPTLYERTRRYPKRGEKRFVYQSSPNAVSAVVAASHAGRESTTIMPKTPEGYTERWAQDFATEDGQVPLFLHDETPGYSVLSYMNSVDNPQSKTAAMRLMGIAAIDSIRSGHGEITPDSNLSKHSQRIVQHLDKVGATKMPDDIDTNTTTFMSRPNLTYGITSESSNYKPVPQEDVGAAKGMLRAALRGQRKTKPEPEYEQLQLDID
jgi:hypothetical protein